MSPGGLLEEGSSLRGIACMLVSGIFLTTNDSITKWLVPHYPAGEILFVQGTLLAWLVAAWMRLRGEHPLRITRWRAHLYRGLLYAAGSFAFVYALKYLPLAEVIAIAFAGPLFMTLFGKLFLGETVGPHSIDPLAQGRGVGDRLRRGPAQIAGEVALEAGVVEEGVDLLLGAVSGDRRCGEQQAEIGAEHRSAHDHDGLRESRGNLEPDRPVTDREDRRQRHRRHG